MDCYGDVLHFINANYLNYAIMPEYARVGQSMHVVQLIPGFLFKSFNGAPSAAKNRSRSGRKVPACRNPSAVNNREVPGTIRKHSPMMASVDSRAFLQKLELCPWSGPKRPPKRAETARCHFSQSRSQPKMFETLRKHSPMMASVDSRAFLQKLEQCPWSCPKRPPKRAETGLPLFLEPQTAKNVPNSQKTISNDGFS